MSLEIQETCFSNNNAKGYSVGLIVACQRLKFNVSLLLGLFAYVQRPLLGNSCELRV